MGTGAITQYIDVAQIVLYLFWIFFFWLVVWLVADRLLNFQDGQLRELGKEEVRMLVSVGRKEE